MPVVRLPEKNLFPSLEPIEGQKVEEEFDKITDESKLDSLLSKEPSKLDEILENSSSAMDVPPKTITTVRILQKTSLQQKKNNKFGI
jgi:hypothetical protein